jgi:heptosyltransferase-2
MGPPFLPSHEHNGGKQRLLLLEFWGLGDLTFATGFIHAATARYDVTIAAKPHAKPLLEPTFRDLSFIAFDPPWTVFRGKYNLLRWNWQLVRRTLGKLRSKRFDAAVSVRADPRDHFLMWLAGARHRLGFPAKGSGLFLNDRVILRDLKAHRVERWRALGAALQLPGIHDSAPRLAHANYRTPRIDECFARLRKPVLCLHTGARLPTRRWPERSFAELLERLRARFDFHLVLVPDPDGYGRSLGPMADVTLCDVSIAELVDLLGRSDLLLCNDSGPAHLAAACGRPVIPIFGPTDPDWFYPWGNRANVVIRDICPWRPCFDYCKFREPHCLTKLSPETAWRDIAPRIDALIATGALSPAFRKTENVVTTP